MSLANKTIFSLIQIPGHETDDNNYNNDIYYKHSTMVISLRWIKELQI